MNTTLDFTELPQDDIPTMILRSQAAKKNGSIILKDNMDEESKTLSDVSKDFSPVLPLNLKSPGN